MSSSTTQINLSDSNRFLWLFFIGASLMLIIKLVLSVKQIFVTLPPTVIMILYFTQLARAHHATNRPERAGDNIYYLGFLFTLVSLGLALYEFGVNPEEKSGLIADFAVALITTILGVLFRVWLTQGDREVDEYEREAKLHIADAIDELRDDLERSRESMIEFASITRQVLEENRDEQRKQLEQDREEFERHFSASLSKMSDVLTEAVKGGADRLNVELERLATNIADQVGKFTANVETLNAASGSLSSTLATAVDAFSALPDIKAMMDAKVQAIVGPLEVAGTEMVGILDSQKDWAQKSASAVSKIVENLAALDASIAKIGTSGAASLEKLQHPVNQMSEQLAAVQSALAAIAMQIEGANDLGEAFAQLPQQLSRSVGDLDTLGISIGTASEKVAGTLIAFNADLERARAGQLEAVALDAGSLRQLADDRNRLIENLSGANKQIEEQIVLLRNQLGDMSEALIGAAKFIRQEAGAIS